MNLNKIYKNYHEYGFVIVKKLLKKNDISKILKELEIIKIKAVKTRINQYYHKTNDGKINTLHNIQKYQKNGAVINVANSSKIKKILAHLIKDQVKIRNIEFFLKPKKTGMPSPFHQDNFYWNIVNGKALNCWIACSDASRKNGGLAYLVGSHNLGTVKHQISFAKGSSQKIPDEILTKLKFKKEYPTIKAGDCLVHHSEIIHGSKRNASNKDRIGLVISYEAKNRIINKFTNLEYEKNVKKNLKKIYSEIQSK